MPGTHATPEDLDGLSRAVSAALAKQQETIAEHAAALEAARARAGELERRIAALEGSSAPPPSSPAPAGKRRTFDFTEPVDGAGPPARNFSMPASVSDWIDYTKGNAGLRPDYATFNDIVAFDREVSPYQQGEVGLPGMTHPVLHDSRRGPIDTYPGHLLQYVDAASREWLQRDLSRAAWQNRRHLAGTLGMGEGQEVWILWIEKWLAADVGNRVSTSRVQFRNQPDAWHLRRIGIDPTLAAAHLGIKEADMLFNLDGTGPCSSLYLTGDGTSMRYGMEVREGALSATQPFKPGDGTAPGTWRTKHNVVAPDPIVVGRWDKCLLRFRSSRGADGAFDFWRWPVDSIVTGGPITPTITYRGPTEYQNPVLSGIQVTACPHHYHEIYRWCRKAGNAGTSDTRIQVLSAGSPNQNRYMAVATSLLDYYVGTDGRDALLS